MDGTTRWTVAPTPGPNLSWFEGPIYTHRIDASGPDMFMVETNTTTWERTLRAVSASGEVDWLAASPGVPLMGDMYGGVVAGVEPSPNYCVGPFNEIQRCYTALTRVPGAAGTAAWRYDSPGLVDRPAQGPDGTIYVVEHTGDHLYQPNNTGNAYFPYPGEKTMVILDGATGAVTARVPLAGDAGYEPVTVGPIVSGDGFGYVLVTKGMEITLRRLSRDGQAASTVIVPATCTGGQCRAPVPGQLLPNGLGGLLMTADWGNASYLTVDFRLTRFDGDGGRTDTVLSTNSGSIELIGQGGTAYMKQTSGQTVSQPVMDIATWTPRWHLPAEWTFLAARPDGGVLAENAAGDLGSFDGTGQLLEVVPSPGLRNPVQMPGSKVGNSGLAPNSAPGLRMVAWRGDDATYWDNTRRAVFWTGKEQYGFGYRTGQNAPEPTYATVQEAAIRRMRDYNARSIDINREFGGSICRTAQGRYIGTWSLPLQPPNSDFVFPTGCESLIGLATELAGRYHTHGRFGDVGLSPGDAGNAHNAATIPWFVASPCGGMYEYSAYTTPRPWYRWLTSPNGLLPIYGKPLPGRTHETRTQCPVDIGIAFQ